MSENREFIDRLVMWMSQADDLKRLPVRTAQQELALENTEKITDSFVETRLQVSATGVTID